MTLTAVQTDGLMARLKEATAELHRHAETRAFQKSLLKGDASPALYRTYLIELHAIHTALEEALAQWRVRRPELASVFGEHQQRAADLVADIHDLGARDGLSESTPFAATTNAGAALVEFITANEAHNVVALLGCLYVLEGSMNGNTYIARALSGAWSIADGRGLRYLNPYGTAQRETWQQFRTAMNALEVSPEEIEQAVAAACLVFQSIADISDEIMERLPAT